MGLFVCLWVWVCQCVERILLRIDKHNMGWLRWVGSIKLQVSFAEYHLFYRALLQKRPIILRSLLIVATPYVHIKKYVVLPRHSVAISMLQLKIEFKTHWYTLQHTAAHCKTLQHTGTHCSTLQHTAAHWQHTGSTLQHTAAHCNKVRVW